ncbi:MAG: nucleotidyltransferase family protein [Marinibacterium sp.]
MKTASVMLFAAGFGTRMGALTADRPKPMIKVAGRPLVDHALDLARAIDPPRIVANVHYKPQMLADHLAHKGAIISHEWPDILETGGGLRAALPLLGAGPVLTLNTDAIWAGPNPLDLLVAAWDETRMDALLMCLDPANALGHRGAGDFVASADGQISRGPGLVYAGAQLLNPADLNDVPDSKFSLNVVWDRMMAQGRAFALRYPGQWVDVGHPDNIVLAERLLHGDV